MAAVLRLANEDQGDTADLLAGTMKLVDQSWSTRTAPVESNYAHFPFGAQSQFSHMGLVRETMRLTGEDSVANLIAAIGTIEDLLERARMFHADPQEGDSIWFEWNANGESAKRALIYEASLQHLTGVGLGPLLDDGKALSTLNFTRHPLFETPTAVTVSETGISLWGGTKSITSVPGTSPARIVRLQIADAGDTSETYRFWCGIRRAYNGVGSFISKWELEDGTPGTDTSGVADGTASGGDKMRCTFATVATMDERVTINVADVYGSNYSHAAGRYLLLGRVKVTAGEVAIRLKYGYAGATNLRENDDVFVTNTSWRLIPLGEVILPPEGRTHLDGSEVAIWDCCVSLWAERIDGSGYLDMDVVGWVPNQHYCGVDGGAIPAGSNAREANVYTLENDEVVCKAVSATAGYNDALVPDPRGWYLPRGDSILVFFGEAETAHVLTGARNLYLYYYPRWLSYRGS